MIWLALLFAVIATLYASVGFGGGSSYTALLTLYVDEKQLIPVISLSCNIIVVAFGVLRFQLARLYNWRKLLPILLVSAPLAFFGGFIPIKEQLFLTILGASLLLSAIALLMPLEQVSQRALGQPTLLVLSSLIGLLAGMSGIGGGIFIAPILHLIRWDEPKRIAAFASLYILVNSVMGMAGQLIKLGADPLLLHLPDYGLLLLAVFIGGQFGGIMAMQLFSPLLLRRATGILVAYAAIYLLWKNGI